MKITNKLIHTFVLCSLAGFSSSALAQKCPTIKEGTSEINVNDGKASLWEKAGETGEKGPTIQKGDPLEIITSKEIQTADGKCWYKVKKPDEEKQYWIQQIGIPEAQLISVQDPPPPPPKKEDTWFSPGLILDGIKSFFTSYQFGILLLVILVGLYIWWIDKRLQELREGIKRNHASYKKYQDKLSSEISTVKKYSEGLPSQLEKINRKLNKIETQIVELGSRQLIPQLSEQYGQAFGTSPVYGEYGNSSTEESVFQQEVEISPTDTLRFILDKFNAGDRNYFENGSFLFLRLTQAASKGSQGLGMNALPKAEFESVTDSVQQATYIGFKIGDEKFYMIPNIFNSRWKQVVDNDGDQIFVSGSSDYKLAEPATIEDTGNGTWQLVNSGRFQ